MTTQFTQQIFSSTYKDDFKDSDSYHRILFNSGRALQARELTQLQTIIQAEMERLGRHLFKEGAAINPGGVMVNNQYEFIKLDSTVNPLPPEASELVGVELTTTGGIIVEVLEAIDADGNDPATLYVRYISTASGISSDQPIRVAPSDNLTAAGYTFTIQATNTITNPAVGKGTKAYIHGGDFFTQGHFVFAAQQSAIISKYTTTPSVDIGFKVEQFIVTTADDVELFDNQGATPNLSAPGADRYQIKLTFSTRTDIANDENFVYVAKVVDGQIGSQVTGVDDYNKINDVMAIRTKEESGNYISKKFTLKFDDNGDNLDFVVSPGTAYVNGYRANRDVSTVIPVAKPRTTVTQNNEVVAANYGNYILSDDNKGIANTNNIQSMSLFDTKQGVGNVIGTARVRFIEEDDGNTHRLYLMMIEMQTGQTFRDVRSIGTSTTNYWDFLLENSQAVLKNVSNTSLLFALPSDRPQALSDISLTVQRRFVTQTSAAGAATISLTATGETFADTNDWVMAANSSAVVSPTVTGAGSQSASIIGGPASSSGFEILAYVNKAAGIVRSKTLVTVSETITPDGTTGNVTLTHPDVYRVVEILANSSSGASLAPRFTIDNGQRDNYYAQGVLNLKGGQSAATGDVYVTYDYFQHGTAGDFFAVNSYTGQIDYADIPNHTLADGTVINVRDFLDFRPVVDSSGSFGSGSTINELPKNADLIQADVNYYNAKACSVIISTNGLITVQESTESLSPSNPETPSDALEIYRVTMKPYTISSTDVNMQAISAKRFTMADIGRLEKRLDNLEEVTSLNLLELNTSSLDVLDADGLSRIKSGFFVDNFADQARSATFSPEYRASIDPNEKIMRPQHVENNIRYIYDDAKSSNTVKKGDNVYLTYDHVTYLDQSLASGSVNVNPFAVVTNRGWLEITPSSDEWRETRYIADRVIDGGLRIETDQATLWNNWAWNWTGNETVGTTVGSNEVGRTTTTARVIADETIREIVDDRVVDVALIPFMRSKKIYFRAIGLRPNTRHFAYFDNTPVADWVRAETFTRSSDDPIDFGTEYANATGHPQGVTVLTTDVEGRLEGSFFLPSTNDIKFRAGQSEFKLLDLSSPTEQNASSIASTSYVSQGVLERRQRDILSTRILKVGSESVTRPESGGGGGSGNTGDSGGGGDAGGGGNAGGGGKDPTAQTFTVDQATGIFVTKIGVRFQTKASVAPVVLQIRPVVNGHPASNEFVPGATTWLSPSAVSTSTDATVVTYFEFDEPVYLSGGVEYAVVILTDSVDYNVYVAEVYQFLIGSTERRVNAQPTLGSLFKSQNSTTWEPDQTKDLTFEVVRANFNVGSGTVILENAEASNEQLVDQPFTTSVGSTLVEVYHPTHGFGVSDEVTIAGAGDVGGILAANLDGQRVIDQVDGLGYTFTAGSTANSTVIGGGTSVVVSQNVMFDVSIPYIENILPPQTVINYASKFMSGSSLAGQEAPYVKDIAFSPLFNKTNNVFGSPRLLATPRNELSAFGAGTKSVTTQVTMGTTSSFVSPVVDMQRCSLALVSNLIDQQSATTATGFNVPLNFVSETDPFAGSSLAKHITQPVSLADQAVGLKILLAANRPSVSNFDVYYRTNNNDSDLLFSPWVLVPAGSAIPSDENDTVFRDYSYLIGGTEGGLVGFDQFQVKIVMRSTNSSKVPSFRDLRVIAMGT